MDAFDADVLIYAAEPDHPLGRRVAALLPIDPIAGDEEVFGVGSVILLTEVLSKPIREEDSERLLVCQELLGRLELSPTSLETAKIAASLSAAYRLQASDAIHLATAVELGADRFITNNKRDFSRSIVEIDITYPEDLPDP
jgi:predicted nucleic acid-binding protein